MKRVLTVLLCGVFLTLLPLTVYARNALYPVSVTENHDNGRREIIRTYELTENENPDNIPRDSFIREGWLYELTEITKQESARADTRDYTETVTIDTATNDMAAILALLAPTMDYKCEDGYIGTLHLDISTIKVESAGSRSSSYTVTATREYPHLSSNDTSLVPKTITDNGRTLTLSGIDWKVQNYATIDYDRVPDAYTAVATYTGTAWRNTVTGYITTAEYNGAIAKILTGRTVYTAYFIGAPMVPAATEAPTEPSTESSTAAPTTTTPEETVGVTEREKPVETAPPSETDSEENDDASVILPLLSDNLHIILAVLAGLGVIGLVIFALWKKPTKKEEPKKPTTKRRKPVNDEKTD